MEHGAPKGVVPANGNSGAEPGGAAAGRPYHGRARSSGALTAAIQAALAGAGIPALAAGARRLTASYRSGDAPTSPVLATKADAAAYAAYRMPATAAATALALQQTRLSLPGWRPTTVLDLGAGTGGVAWSVAAQLPSVEAMTLLEQSAAAISVGRAILKAAEALGSAGSHEGSSAAMTAATPVPRAVTFRAWRLAADQPEVDQAAAGLSSQPDDLPTADLATVGYVLGELTDAQQAAMVALAVRAAPAIVLVEPGTPAGHRRILLARERLLASGYLLAAPCPHDAECPLAAVGDWCHFAARLQRSAVHRQVKGAELGYEDEKFSYVAAVRPSLLWPGAPPDPALPAARIVRRPQQRKNLVTLDVCRRDGTAGPELIGKSARETYRDARKSSWGDRWEHAAPCRACGSASG
jgi:ribosomal protein RSM22 (predicted rRNA methylase)